MSRENCAEGVVFKLGYETQAYSKVFYLFKTYYFTPSNFRFCLKTFPSEVLIKKNAPSLSKNIKILQSYNVV